MMDISKSLRLKTDQIRPQGKSHCDTLQSFAAIWTRLPSTIHDILISGTALPTESVIQILSPISYGLQSDQMAIKKIGLIYQYIVDLVNSFIERKNFIRATQLHYSLPSSNNENNTLLIYLKYQKFLML